MCGSGFISELSVKHLNVRTANMMKLGPLKARLSPTQARAPGNDPSALKHLSYFNNVQKLTVKQNAKAITFKVRHLGKHTWSLSCRESAHLKQLANLA